MIKALAILLLPIMVTSCNLSKTAPDAQEQQLPTETQELASPTETIPPYMPLPTLTPSLTLRPPPTFEPPTLTPFPSLTPTVTPTPVLDVQVSLPNLQGLDTATPEGGSDCEPRDDWTLTYEVQPNDALASIADRYGTYANVLAEGNCLADPNLIVVGQKIHVPGDAHPSTPAFVCDPWELLTPFNGTVTVAGTGQITFNWRGPETPRYLVRIWHNNTATGNHVLEILVELRMNQTLDVSEIPDGGTYSWRVYPLGWDFNQIPCLESDYSIFTKETAPIPTP
jgi:LysM repeat protein